MADRTHRSAIAGRRGHWLLDLDLGGQVLHIAGEDLAVTNAAGDEVGYLPGLDEPDIEYSLAEGSPRSIALTIQPTAGIDFAALDAQGIDVSGARGTLRRWFEGQVLEAARTVLIGRVSEPEWGDIDEPLVLSLEAFPWSDTVLIPDAEAVVGVDTFTVGSTYTADEQLIGTVYPTVIGNPGKIASSGVTDSVPCVPALMVEFGTNSGTIPLSKLLVAGHAVVATVCNVWDLSAEGVVESVASRPILTTTDLRGRVVSYVTFDGSGRIGPYLGHEYRTSWFSGGGIHNLDRTGALRGAGELIIWLMRQATDTAFNEGAQQAQRAYLDTFRIDAYIAERVRPWDWIKANLANILPIRWVETGAGGFWAAMPPRALAQDAVMRIDCEASPECQPAGTMRRSPRADVRNKWVLRYAFDERMGAFARTITLDAATSGDRTQGESLLCKVSQSRYGLIEADDIETRCIYDDATAWHILREMVREFALTRRERSYQCPPEYEALLAGDIVTVTDPGVYLSEAVARVVDVVASDGRPAVTVRLLDDPENNTKRTS